MSNYCRLHDYGWMTAAQTPEECVDCQRLNPDWHASRLAAARLRHAASVQRGDSPDVQSALLADVRRIEDEDVEKCKFCWVEDGRNHYTCGINRLYHASETAYGYITDHAYIGPESNFSGAQAEGTRSSGSGGESGTGTSCDASTAPTAEQPVPAGTGAPAPEDTSPLLPVWKACYARNNPDPVWWVLMDGTKDAAYLDTNGLHDEAGRRVPMTKDIAELIAAAPALKVENERLRGRLLPRIDD